MLRLTAASIALDEIASMRAEDHRQAFTAFAAGLLADFDRDLQHGDVDLYRGGVSYRIGRPVAR